MPYSTTCCTTPPSRMPSVARNPFAPSTIRSGECASAYSVSIVAGLPTSSSVSTLIPLPCNRSRVCSRAVSKAAWLAASRGSSTATAMISCGADMDRSHSNCAAASECSDPSTASKISCPGRSLRSLIFYYLLSTSIIRPIKRPLRRPSRHNHRRSRAVFPVSLSEADLQLALLIHL